MIAAAAAAAAAAAFVRFDSRQVFTFYPSSQRIPRKILTSSVFHWWTFERLLIYRRTRPPRLTLHRSAPLLILAGTSSFIMLYRCSLLILSGIMAAVATADAAGRSAEWYAVYGSGISRTVDGLNNTGWAAAHRHSATGYATCCGCWGLSSNGAFELNPQRLDGGGKSLCGGTHFADVVAMGLSVIPGGGLDAAALLSGAWKTQGAAAAAAVAVRENGWSGLEIDAE